MNLLMRAAFVVGGVFVGINLINYYVLGNSGDYLPSGTLVAADFGSFAAPDILRVMNQEKQTRDICKR